MGNEFFPARLKLERAEAHISEADRLIKEYKDLDPHYTLEWVEGNYLHFELYRTVAPPKMLPAVIGDALHNLRVSLDATATALVALKGKSTKDVYFPFANSAGELDRAIKGKNFHHAGQEAVEVLKALKPYKGGNQTLRAVHDLDIEDKHSGILLQVSLISYQGGAVGMIDDKIGKLTWGSQLLREGVLARNGKFSPPVDIRFHHRSPLADKEVVKTLHGLAEDFRRIVDAFELCALGTIAK